MICNNCGNEVTAMRINGKCPICGKLLQQNANETKTNEVTKKSTTENSISLFIALVSIILLLGGIGAGIYFITNDNTIIGIIYILSGIIGSAITAGISTIIDLLEKINKKLK